MVEIKEKTQKYIVLMKNTLGHKVGDTIELTDLKAKSLVNKVGLKSAVATSKAKKKKVNLVGKVDPEVHAEKVDNSEQQEEINKVESELTSIEKGA